MTRFRDAAAMLSHEATPEESLRKTAHLETANELAEELVFLLGEELPEALR
jgi:hypothetical protein